MASPAAVLSILVNANTAQANAALARTDAQLKKTAVTANTASAGIGSKIAKGARFGGLAVAALGAVSIKAAADFESSFAEVRKTVDTSERGFKRLEKGLRNMAKEIPVSVNELNELAGQAGALGIKAKDLLRFTRTAAELGITTDLSATDAANALARLSNIMGTSPKDFRRLGSVMVELGNTTAATESEIAAMALRIAAAGRASGLSEADVLAFSASLASVGVRAEAGGSSISKAFDTIRTATIQGGEDLRTIAETAGMTAGQFRKAYEEDAAKAMTAFAVGIRQIEAGGGDAVSMLKELELGDIRVMQSLRGAANASDLLKIALKGGNAEWQRNSALTQEASKRYATTSAQFQVFKNRVNDLFITLGQLLLPVVNKVLRALNNLNLNAPIRELKEFWREAGIVRAAVRVMGNVVEQIFRSMANVIRGVVKVISGLLTGNFRRAWDGVKDIFRGAVGNVLGQLRGMTAPIRAVAKVAGEGLADGFQAGINAVKTLFRGLARGINRVIGGIADGFITLAVTIKVAAEWIVRAVKNIVGAFSDLAEKVPDVSLSLPNIPNPKDIVPGLRRGGPIFGGKASGDSIPAMLERGEYVLNRKAVEKVGKRNLDALNFEAAPRFAKGGPIPNIPVKGSGPLGAIARGGIGLMRDAANRYAQKHSGPSATWESIDALAAKLGLARGTLTGRLGQAGSWHGVMGPGGRARATDYSAPIGDPDMFKFGSILARSIGKKLLELIYTPLGYSISDGAKVAPYAQADHYDHVHVAMRKGGQIGEDFAKAVAHNAAPYKAAVALFAAGKHESGFQDLGYGHSSSQGVLQLLSSTAAGLGISPHNEYAIANAFLTQGFWGKGSGIQLARQGLNPAVIAHLVQGNATGTGVYAAEIPWARSMIKKLGLRYNGQEFAGRGAGGAGGPGGGGPKAPPPKTGLAGATMIPGVGKAVMAAQPIKGMNQVAKSSLPGSAGGLPPHIQAMLATAYSYADMMAVGDFATALAEGTATKADDIAANIFRLDLLKGEKLRLQRRINKINRQLQKGGLSNKQRQKLLNERSRLYGELGSVQSDISSTSGLIADLSTPEEGVEGTGDLTEAILALTAEFAKSNAYAESVGGVSSREAWRAIADLLSGQIAGNIPGGQSSAAVNSLVRY